jgi:hypothetical protein
MALRTAGIKAWTAREMARDVKRLFVEFDITRDQIVAISHGRSGVLAGFIFQPPYSVLVVWDDGTG